MRKPAARPKGFMQRQLKAHARILLAIVIGVIVWLAAYKFSGATRFLIAWNVAVWIFLALVMKMMATASIADLRKRAGLEEEGRVATLCLVTIATAVAFVALGVELADALPNSPPDKTFRVAIAFAAILGSWFFVNISFALHYAHEVYRTKLSVGSLDFPNEKEPDYWDFLYFAMVLGTTFQTSDVEIRSRVLRRTAMAQGILAFLFNTAIIALTVGAAAKLVGG
jgi:uncharacterized membrane protein